MQVIKIFKVGSDNTITYGYSQKSVDGTKKTKKSRKKVPSQKSHHQPTFAKNALAGQFVKAGRSAGQGRTKGDENKKGVQPSYANTLSINFYQIRCVSREL